MTLTLLLHQWRSFWRSRNAGRSLAAQIFIGFLILYLTTAALFIGIGLRHFLRKVAPGQDVVRVFCSFILYYFAFDILLRFMFQELPVLSIQPYLAQNIKRNRIVRFLNIRSLFHFLNIIPIFLFVPFTATAIASANGAGVSFAFIAAILLLTVFNHFLSMYIKRRTIISSWWFLGFVLVVAAFIALDRLGVFSVGKISTGIFTALLARPWLVIVAIVLAILSYLNNQRFLRQNLYLEEIAKKTKRKESAEYTWLQQLGLTGELVAINLKMILRNKRPRATMIVSALILFYGFIFYTPENLNASTFNMLMFGALFVTGIFILNFGQFLFAWHSSYFDGLMSSNISMETFIRSSFLLFTAASTISLLLSSFYGFISWKILPIQLAAYLYNLGVNAVLAVYLATRSYKGIDLSKSASFNYQGTGATTWLYAFLVMLLPVLICVSFTKIFHSPWAGIIALGAVGLVSLLLQGFWIDKIIAGFKKRKHTILQGFREK